LASEELILRVDHNVTYIQGRMEKHIYDKFKKELGYRPENAFWMIKNNSEKAGINEKWKKDWDGTISCVCWNQNFCHCHIKKKGTHFQTGLLWKAKKFFEEHNIPVQFVDIREKTPKTDRYSMSPQFEHRDYQIEIINKIIGNDEERGKDRGIIKVATGGGKCCSKDSICLTEDGMIEIGEIEEDIGDEEYCKKKIKVFTPFGERDRDVSSHIYRDGEKKSFKITTSYGYSITGTPNHRIIVIGKHGEFEWKRMDKIDADDVVVLSKNQNIFGNNNDFTVEEAYFLGLLYGDGSLNSRSQITFTTVDDHLEDYFNNYALEAGFKVSSYSRDGQKHVKDLRINNTEYRTSILDKGVGYCLSHTKKIPLSIRTSPKNIIAAFLRGIYETDGCVELCKDRMSITLGLSNEKLIDQIHYILLNMGIVSSKRKKKTTHRDCFILTIYRDFIKKFIDIIGFDPEGYKRKRSYKYYSDFINRNKNSNKDLIYNQSENIETIRDFIRDIFGARKYRNIIEKESGIKFSVFGSWLGSGSWRNPSRSSLLSFLKWAEYKFITLKVGSNDPKYKNFKKIILEMLDIVDEKYYYDKVKSIKKCKSDNYDFVIPKTHSFVANGMINHNTSIASSIIAGIGVSPTIFYVPSIDLLKQAKDEIEKFVWENGSPVEVGMVGGGKKDIKDITVMTIQTAVRALGGVWVKFDEEDSTKDNTDITDIKEDIKHLIQNCRLMICDEVQHWASETCQIISDNSKMCHYRFALSATPYRDKGDDILIDACFGRVIADVNASFLIKKGFLVKPIIYFSKIDNMRGLKKMSYANVYKQAIVENEKRNAQIVTIANRFYNSGRKILILVKQISHGKLLEKLIPNSTFLYGGTGKKKREKHLEIMKKGLPQITIASVIFDEGIDCKPLDTIILAGGGKSSTRALQRIGRILRPYPNKHEAIAVDFMDNCKYMQGHSSKRAQIYRTEEEFDIEIME
jgi:superfamily II DNA or RNA helicase/intein/homing endonuclease